MTLALVVACACVVGGGGAVVVLRRFVDERRGMRDHQHTLDTLRRVGAGSTPAVDHLAAPEPHLVVGHGADRPPVRPAGPPVPAGPGPTAEPPALAGRPAEAPPLAEAPALAVPTTEALPQAGAAPAEELPVQAWPAAPVTPVVPGVEGDPVTGPPTTVMPVGGRPEADPDPTAVLRPVVFDETSALPVAGSAPAGWPAPRRRQPPRSLRLATLAVAVAVLAAVGATAYALARPSASSGPPTGSAAARPASSSGTGRGSGSHSSHGSTTGRGSSIGIVTGTATTTGATVSVPGGSYTVTVSVTNACWVQGQASGGSGGSGSAGAWAGVLTAGQHHAFSFTGPASVELGAADAAITVGHTAVSLPTGYQVPFTLQFRPPN